VGVLARYRSQHEVVTAQQKAPDDQEARCRFTDALLKLDDLSLEVGYGLVAPVDKQGGQLLQRVRALRRHWPCNGVHGAAGPHYRQHQTARVNT
jgi:flagellar biosynthesis component FlhA